MARKRTESGAAQSSAAPIDAREDDSSGFVADLLGAVGPTAEAAGFSESRIASWVEEGGMLEGGRVARLSASCLLRPESGDRVLIWRGGDGCCWVLNVLERANADAAAVIAAGGAGFAIRGKTVSMSGQAVHIAAEDFLTSTRNRHAVENTRTVNCKLRVSQIGTDIRRVATADEEVSGTLVQRAGTWLSTTMRDARLRARTFLFD